MVFLLLVSVLFRIPLTFIIGGRGGIKMASAKTISKLARKDLILVRSTAKTNEKSTNVRKCNRKGKISAEVKGWEGLEEVV